MSNKKDKKKDNIFIKLRDSIDGFIFVFLIVFICLCIYFKVNTFVRILLAIVFMIGILLVYLARYKQNIKIFANNKIIQIVDNLTREELEEYIKIYYTRLGYKVNQNDKNELYIEKNNKKYIIYIFINKCDLEEIKSNYLDNIIVITNINFTKEQVEFIRKYKLFSISQPGLINIIKSLSKEIENRNKESEEAEEETKEDETRR